MPDTLNAGSSLQAGQVLQSNNQRHVLAMQHGGNLVLVSGITLVWQTNTHVLPSFLRPVRATMQDDGNFVLYSANNMPAWATGTHGAGGGVRLVLQDDRNLVIYDQNGTAVWATNTPVAAPLPAAVNVPVSVGGRQVIAAAFTGEPTRAFEREEIGFKKYMETEAKLYSGGLLAVSTKTQNRNWTGGLRGRVLVVCYDSEGHGVWVSRQFVCTTRCSVPDVSCASDGTDTFFEQFPGVIGKYATRLDIYQSDAPDLKPFRDRLIEDIKAAGDVAQEIKDQWHRLV